MNDEYKETLRILRTSIKTSNCVQLNDYGMVLMNNKLCGTSGVSRSQLFLSRPPFYSEMPLPHVEYTTVQDWILTRTRQRRRFKSVCSVGGRHASSV